MGEAAFGYQLNSQRNDSSSSIYYIFNGLNNNFTVLETVPYLF
jgi:hypothetical protein